MRLGARGYILQSTAVKWKLKMEKYSTMIRSRRKIMCVGVSVRNALEKWARVVPA